MSSQMTKYIGKVQKGPEHNSFCLHADGGPQLPGIWIHSTTQTQSEPCGLGLLWKFHYAGMID